MTITTETLQRFCAGPLEARLWLRRPFREGGRIFATNGAFFVGIADDGRPLDFTHELKGTHMTRPVQQLPIGEGAAIPDLPAAIPCQRCGGTGTEPHDADFQGEPMQCIHCDGMGEQPSAYWLDGIPIGPGRFQARLLRLLQVLPGVVLVPGRDERSMAGIRFDGGGIGGIMPLRREG